MLPSEAVFSLTHATSSSFPMPHAIPPLVAVFALSGTRAILAPGTGSVAQTARDRNVGRPLASALSPPGHPVARCPFGRREIQSGSAQGPDRAMLMAEPSWMQQRGRGTFLAEVQALLGRCSGSEVSTCCLCSFSPALFATRANRG